MKRSALFIIALSLAFASYAQDFQEINLSKVIAFPKKYEGKGVALLGYQVHGEVKPLGKRYAVYVSSAGYDIYPPSYGDTVTFLVSESLAEKITDAVEAGHWISANLYGHVQLIENAPSSYNPATCIILDRIDLVYQDGSLFKRLEN